MRRTTFNTRNANSVLAATSLELGTFAPVRPERLPPRGDDLERQLRAVHTNDDEVVRVVLDGRARPSEVFDPHACRGVLLQVHLQVWLAAVRVGRRAASACHQMIDAIVPAAVDVPLDEVVQEVIVAAERHPHVMLAEEWQIHGTDRGRLWLENRPAMQSRIKWGVVENGEDVAIPRSIEM